MQTTQGQNYIDARIREMKEAVVLLTRNVDKEEWKALESNLRYTIAKANAALTKLHAMQQAWIDEMDATT